MNEAKALRHVELLARIVVARLDGAEMIGECDKECQGSQECGKVHAGDLVCPACKTLVPYEKECDNLVECGDTCTADIDVELDSDSQNLLRDLRLALVELDIARSENAPSIYEDGR